MDQHIADSVSAFASQPIRLTQGKSVMVQQLSTAQSTAQLHQINPPNQQSLGLETAFPINTVQLSGNSPVDMNMSSSESSVLATQEQTHIPPRGSGSVFATVPISVPMDLTHTHIVLGSGVANKLGSFWHDLLGSVNSVTDDHWKNPEFPLARIKKIMRMDEDVRMISAEVPVMLSKAVEIFTSELTMRAWLHTEDSKRRTIQRSDIAMAITKNDVFDFLIDIVPREEIQLKAKPIKSGEGENLQLLPPDLLQLYIQQLALNMAGEGGENGIIQQQLQTLQQLMHIQQLQEQQQQQVSTGLDQSVEMQPPEIESPLFQQQTSLSDTQSTIVEAQVLQASETTTAEMKLMEEIADRQDSNTMQTSPESHVLHPLNASELLKLKRAPNTATVVIQSPMVVTSTAVDIRQDYQLQSLEEHTTSKQEHRKIHQQLESIAKQVLIQPTTDIEPCTSSEHNQDNSGNIPAGLGIPTEFAAGMRNQSNLVNFSIIPDNQMLSGSMSSTSESVSSTPNLQAFKSTPLRLTHVHGSSALVELPTSVVISTSVSPPNT